MVSSRTLTFAATLITAGLLSAQGGQSLLDSSKPNPLPQLNPLNPEQRADILMARKMYREAVDVYKEGPLESAIIWNKIGIAYHQMLQIDEAKRNYEQSLKLNPHYSEAINNLGTIYYSKRRYRKAIGQYNKALKLAPNSASIY